MLISLYFKLLLLGGSLKDLSNRRKPLGINDFQRLLLYGFNPNRSDKGPVEICGRYWASNSKILDAYGT